MTSINGIDSIVVDTIKVQTQKPKITEAKKAKISEDQKDEEKGKRHQGHSNQRLMAAVEKLNKILELNKLPIYGQIITNNELVKVQLININNDNIIAVIFPERIYKLVTELNTKGFTVDELI